MVQISDIVKHIIILNVLMFVLANTPVAQFLPDLSLHYPGLESFKPYQVISHMFMHGGPRHLIFNMLGLLFIGPTVERTVGKKRFFILYFACGLGAVILRSWAQYTGLTSPMIPAVGASGAVLGVVAAFAIMYPKQPLYLMFIPIPIKAMYLVGGFFVWDLYCAVTGAASGIAHFAHLGGAITAFVLVFFAWRLSNLR